MTRINCIEPTRLNKQMLVAEYREMLRVRHLHPRKPGTAVPSYRLGKGHVLFFADKGAWLLDRHNQLRAEMIKRGITANYELDLSHWPQSAMGQWQPDVEAKMRNVARLINRMA